MSKKMGIFKKLKDNLPAIKAGMASGIGNGIGVGSVAGIYGALGGAAIGAVLGTALFGPLGIAPGAKAGALFLGAIVGSGYSMVSLVAGFSKGYNKVKGLPISEFSKQWSFKNLLKTMFGNETQKQKTVKKEIANTEIAQELNNSNSLSQPTLQHSNTDLTVNQKQNDMSIQPQQSQDILPQNDNSKISSLELLNNSLNEHKEFDNSSQNNTPKNEIQPQETENKTKKKLNDTIRDIEKVLEEMQTGNGMVQPMKSKNKVQPQIGNTLNKSSY